jgi:hypothetical protein
MRELIDKGQVLTTEEMRLLRMPQKEAEQELGVEETTMDMDREEIIARTGLYGRRMIEYLEENQYDTMMSLMLLGELLPIIQSRVEKVKTMMIELEHDYLKKHLNSQMDFMTTVKIRNQARMMAEEIAMNEVIYRPL